MINRRRGFACSRASAFAADKQMMQLAVMLVAASSAAASSSRRRRNLLADTRPGMSIGGSITPVISRKATG